MVKLKYLKMSKIRIILLILFFPFLINSFIVYAQENPLLIIILDCSRSMSGDISGKNKFETAKKIIEDVLSQVKDFDFGLITLGKNETNNPNDIELTVVPIPNNRGKILAELSKIKPKGLSPIGEALLFAEKVLKKGLRSYILLISDGIDNCDGKPLIPVKNLIQNKEVLKIYTIGFDTTQSNIILLQNIAKAGNGSYYHFNNYKELYQSLTKTISTSSEEELEQISEKTIGNISYKCFLEKEGGFPAYGAKIDIIDKNGETIKSQYQWKGIIEDISPGKYTISAKHIDSTQKIEITVLPEQIINQTFIFNSETGSISYRNFIKGSRENMAFGTITKIVHNNGETVYTGNKWEGTIEHLPISEYKIISRNSGITLSKDFTIKAKEKTDIIFEFPLETGQISYQCFLDSAMQKPAYGIDFKIFRVPTDEIVHRDNTRWRGITKMMPVGNYIVSGTLLGKVVNQEVRVSPKSTEFFNLIFNIKQVRLTYECYRNSNNDPANGAEVSVIDAGGNKIEKAVGWRGSFNLPVGNYDLTISYQNITKKQRVTLLPSMSDVYPIKIYLSQ